MDLDAYVAEHAAGWRRLDQLGRRRRRLTAAEADELVVLYQRAATHLSAVRSRSPDPVLVAHLSRIVLQARSALAAGPRFTWRSVVRFFAVGFPLAVYRAAPWWLGVTAGFVGVAVALMWYASTNPEVPRMMYSEGQIDNMVNSGFAGYYTEFRAENFFLRVWTNNAFLAAQCLAGGVLVLPTVYVLIVNVFNLGMVGGVMIGAGRSDVFFGLIVPHGLLELTAVFVAAGLGLRIGWAWIAPGRYLSRGRALGRAGREGMLVALGLVPVLLVSGVIEAFVTPSALPTVVRIGIGAAAFLGFLGYVFGAGLRAARAGESADVEDADLAAPVA